MRRLVFVLLLAMASLGSVGCAGRTLTVHPDNVWSRNDQTWKIASEPARAR